MDENLKREIAIETFKLELDYSVIKCIIIVGRRGCGKTQLSYYLARKFEEYGLTARIIEEETCRREFKEAPHVIVDKLGANPLVIVSQGRYLYELCKFPLAVDLIINADVIKFDRSLGYYGPNS